MAISELTKIVTPPASPIDAGPIEKLESVQQQLGLTLPDDLIDVALAYGSGAFSRGQFSVLNPFADSYVSYVGRVCDLYRRLKRDEGDEFFPYDLFPKQTGLFPWGQEDNGHEMFLLTEGDPNEWPIILYRSATGEFERLTMPVTTYLSKVLAGDADCIIFSGMTLLPEFDPAD